MVHFFSVSQILIFINLFILRCSAVPQPGIREFEIDKKNEFITLTRTVYKNSKLYIRALCDPQDSQKPAEVNITYGVYALPCFQEEEDEYHLGDETQNYTKIFENPEVLCLRFLKEHLPFAYIKPHVYNVHCHTVFPSEDLQIPTFKNFPDCSNGNPIAQKQTAVTKEGREVKINGKHQNVTQVEHATIENQTLSPNKDNVGEPYHLIFPQDGVYIVYLLAKPSEEYHGKVTIEIKGDYGYLSAKDWPLLVFYGCMVLVYVLYGFVWLVVSACQWRDLLRIQFWIGGLILLGMLEKAMFYAEYRSINSTGQSVPGAVMFAEVVSCLKRTLARMLVIIVSLGFGIVKPRLGPLLHRVVGVGALYFILSVAEASMRVYHSRNDSIRQLMLAEILLAVLDSFISWWIFSSLIQTTRTLRLRRNVVKLSLYRHFTNTLIFAVLASIAYIIWMVKSHRTPVCLTDWKEVWVDDAFWHLLFSIVLLVIMVLWRPTNNNQRYAFTPLLDATDDEDEEPVVNDAYEGMKLRGMKNQNNVASKDLPQKDVEDDLKWVEENIPTTIADAALPGLLDSDEEIMNTKFEMSKMN